jgi:hypothetical protein
MMHLGLQQREIVNLATPHLFTGLQPSSKNPAVRRQLTSPRNCETGLDVELAIARLTGHNLTNDRYWPFAAIDVVSFRQEPSHGERCAVNILRTGISFLAAAFVTAADAASNDMVVRPEIVDLPEKARIELSYTNRTQHTLCFPAASWPNASGKMSSDGNSVALVVAHQRFPLEPFNTGYCTDVCATRAAPNATILGYLPYEGFRLPEHLMYEAKRLDISVHAYVCSPEPEQYLPKLKASPGG